MSVHRAGGPPALSVLRILEMNLGFLGVQFSFGLQQGNMGPIYSYLGAHEAELPLLQLAGPVTGLIVQPLVGALSDRTRTPWGRRVPYLVLGAAICAVSLFAMPLASSLVMAVSLLWILDAGNNITLEPYRAYVADRLPPADRHVGFLAQAAFTGLAQMLAYLTPSLLVLMGVGRDWVDPQGIPYTVRIVFWIGAALMPLTVLWSVSRVGELPLLAAPRTRAGPLSMLEPLFELGQALGNLPRAMRRLAVMSAFQWFALWGYWTYVTYVVARNVYFTRDPDSGAFHQAVLTNGQMAALYNLVACLAAFAMVPLVRRAGPERVHAACLVAGGAGMLALPHITAAPLLFLPMLGIGLTWGSAMANPYAILSGCVPEGRNGVYMGIYNLMIVIPMLAFSIAMSRLDLGFASFGFNLYERALGGDPRNVLTLCGLCLLAAAPAALWTRGASARP